MDIQLTEPEHVELLATRRDLHQHPEPSWKEQRTAALVAERLRALGLEPRTGVAETGVVADLDTGEPGPCVLLRADMDALPVHEENDLPWRSTNPGVMHACGHDGHVAMLLAAARVLVQRHPPSRGVVRFCFQPAEEGGNGALAMIEAGVLLSPRVDVAYGLHLWNELDRGKVGIVPGPCMAAVDRFEIRVEGRGGHGAIPHRAADPIVAAAHVVTALQTIASRRIDPEHPVVVTVGRIEGGEAFNVIPREVRLLGTARSFHEAAGEALPELVTSIAEQTAAAHGCTARVAYERLSRATVNDPAEAARARDVATRLVGADAVVPLRTMAGEDFSELLLRVPGCFVFVGSRDEATGKVHPHHSPRFDIDERALPLGAALLVALAHDALRLGGTLGG
ncbi:MAG: M20 family metallopeptidase [Planctomycetota bacterium]